jgi:hypothetical protein
MLLKSHVTIAIASMRSTDPTGFSMRDKPRGLVAMDDYKKGEVRLIPRTSMMRTMKLDDTTNSLFLAKVSKAPVSFQQEVGLLPFTSKKHVEPFWCVVAGENANIGIKCQKVPVVAGKDTIHVDIPYLTNIVAVKKYTELHFAQVEEEIDPGDDAKKRSLKWFVQDQSKKAKR